MPPDAARISDSNEGKATMSQDRGSKRAESLRVKEALVDALIGQSDAEVLKDAVQDGMRPDESQRLVLGAFCKARQDVAAPRGVNAQNIEAERAGGRPRGLSIDASRARAILKRVAAAVSVQGEPLPLAAQLDEVKGDAEALQMVATLKDLGVISDEDLK